MQPGRLATTLLMLPGIAMLALIFAAPIGVFLYNVIGDFGSTAKVIEEAGDLLSSRAIRNALLNTNVVALIVTVLVLLIGYPVAYALTRAQGLAFTLIICAIILPYFTSVIVRTYSWMVLLGRNGLINQMLMKAGVTTGPLDLMYNRLGVVVAMTYVLLPYMVLTLYSAMKGIDPALMRAARGMGANGFTVFRRVFFPLSAHGVIAGSLMVFILAIGFFITPALMGGPGDVMIAQLIEREVEISLNWPLAGLMSILLLVVTLALYALYQRFADVERLLG